MRKLNKKAITYTVATSVLLASLGIGGTLAYYSDSETTTNIFSVGDVHIELLEPNYPGNDSDKLKNLLTHMEVLKDPKVENTGVNDAIIFMTLDSPMEFVTLLNEDGSPVDTQWKTEADKDNFSALAYNKISQAKVQELFYYKDASDNAATHANNFDKNWTELVNREMYVVKDENGNEKLVATVSNDYLTDTYNAENPDADKTSDSEEKLSLDLTSEYIDTYLPAASAAYALENAPETNELVLDLDAKYSRGQNKLNGTNAYSATADAEHGNGLSNLQYVLQKAYQNLKPGETLFKRYVFVYNTDIQGTSENDDDGYNQNAKLAGNGDQAGADGANMTTNLFDKIQLRSFIEKEVYGKAEQIKVRAYAIQDSEVFEASEDLTSSKTTDNYEHIYDIFVRQNSKDYTSDGLNVMMIRQADDINATSAGEIERQSSGGFGAKNISHVNRWGTSDNVNGDVVGETGTVTNPNEKPSP